MLALQVVEGHNKARIATIRMKGIHYGGRLHLPMSMDRIDSGSTDPASALGSAALGAVAFGAAGAIVGSLVGQRGRTAVVIRTTEGAELVCTVASDEFPALYVEIQRLIALAATGFVPPPPARVKIEHVLMGPFYFLRFGSGWFLAACGIVILTLGIGWLALPAIAALLDRRQAQSSATP